MSNCKYCGKPAGFLKSQHPECKQKHETGFTAMTELAMNVAYSKQGLNTLEEQLLELSTQSFCFLKKYMKQ
jgi:hypothetical protein